MIIWRRACHGAGNCVEVALLPNGNIGVRDGKHPEAGYQEYTPDEWYLFTAGVRMGLFDVTTLRDWS